MTQTLDGHLKAFLQSAPPGHTSLLALWHEASTNGPAGEYKDYACEAYDFPDSCNADPNALPGGFKTTCDGLMPSGVPAVIGVTETNSHATWQNREASVHVHAVELDATAGSFTIFLADAGGRARFRAVDQRLPRRRFPGDRRVLRHARPVPGSDSVRYRLPCALRVTRAPRTPRLVPTPRRERLTLKGPSDTRFR